MASLYKPGGFLRSPCLTTCCILLNLLLKKRLINDDDDDDDDLNEHSHISNLNTLNVKSPDETLFYEIYPEKTKV